MSALYALLWKEGREILPKVLVPVALAVVVCLMRNNADFNRSYAGIFDGLIMGVLLATAIVLAAAAIAGERSTGTLSFLLDKPVAVATVLAVKFLMGLGGLLLVALAAWATVYIDLASLEANRDWQAYQLVTVQSIDYASMVALSFTQFSLLYALIFISSVVTDHPFKGLAVGISLAVVLGVFLTGPATAILPILNRYPLVAIGLDAQGHLVRLATDSARFWVKVLASLGLTAAALAVAVVLLRRYREAMLSWRTVAIGWGAALVAGFAISYVEVPWNNQRMPVGILERPTVGAYMDLAIHGEFAYMTTGASSIAIADLSNPQQMRLLGSTASKSYVLSSQGPPSSEICVVDSLAYIVGWRKGLPSDSLVVTVFDVSDPTAPTLKGHRMFAAISKEKWFYQYWGATDGGLLLIRERGDALIAEAFALDEEGMPVVGDERVITPIFDLRRERKCHVRVRGSRAYIGTERELVVLDVADAHALRETGRYALESFRPRSYYNSRLIAMDGDALYVERFWPHELVEFDISDPDSLREVGYLPLSPSDRWDLEQLLIANGVAYGLIGHSDVKVRAWTIAGYGALVEGDPLIVPEGPDRDHSWGFNAMSVANGYLYATRRGALLAYRLD